MKPVLITMFSTALFITTLNAQISVRSSAAQATITPTQVSSDVADFDLKTRIAVYHGNVRVTDPQMKLRCELLTAKLPERGGHIESIVAETNVLIDMVDDNGQTNYAKGDKLVYTYAVENAVTNELARLTGNPRVDRADGWLTGDVIIWDFIRKKIRAEGNFHSEPNPSSTNRSPVKIETP